MNRSGSLIQVGKGCFGIAPKPRGGDWLGTDLGAFKSEGFTFVVSMLTDQENVELGLAEEGSLSRAVGLDFYSFPIVDRSVPPSRGDFEEFASQILGVVSKGGRGILHCRAGLGRAPLLGCAVLVQNGVEADVAWNMIQNSRGQPVPDTDEQKAWIKKSGVAVVSLDDALSKLMDGDA